MLSFKKFILNLTAYVLSRSHYISRLCREIVRYYDNDQFADLRNNGELNLIKHMVRHNKDGCFADIGFNKGDYSKHILEQGFQGKLVVVDPLEENISTPLSGLADIVRVEVALSSEVRQGVIHHNIDPDLSGHDSLFKQVESQVESQELTTPVPVSVQTLDLLAEQYELEHFHFIKIDVEGSEYDVLLGGQSLLEKGRIDYIQLEFGHAARVAKVSLYDIYSLLNQYGYIMYVVKPSGVELTKFSPWLENRYSFINLFFARKEICNQIADIEWKRPWF